MYGCLYVRSIQIRQVRSEKRKKLRKIIFSQLFFALRVLGNPNFVVFVYSELIMARAIDCVR